MKQQPALRNLYRDKSKSRDDGTPYQLTSSIVFMLRFKISYLFLALIFLPNFVLAQDITTGLVGHWKFDEGSGTWRGIHQGTGIWER
jgi:hypothetical protein